MLNICTNRNFIYSQKSNPISTQIKERNLRSIPSSLASNYSRRN